jgi:arylsulfatase
MEGAECLSENATRMASLSCRYYRCTAASAPIVTPSPFLGFRLTIDLDLTDVKVPSGVICAHHNHKGGATLPGGWSCYVLDGQIHISVDVSGYWHTVLKKEIQLAGQHRLVIDYYAGELDQRSGDGRPDGTIAVSLDGHEIGDASVASSSVLSGTPWHFFEGKLHVGRDQGPPVSCDYESPFPFTGVIRDVAYTCTGVSTTPVRGEDLTR